MQANVRDVMEPISGPIQNAMQENVQSVRDAVGPITGQIMGPVMTNGPSSNGPNIPRSAAIQDPEPAEGEDTPEPGTFGHYAAVEPPAPTDPGGETPPTSSTDPDAG
jgi:hypothetical protein